MTKHIVIAEMDIETHPEFTLEELCSVCDVTPEFINDLIDYGVLDLETISDRFHAIHLQRVRTVTHLQNDLEVNLPGAALVIELMDEMEKMRTQIEMYEKYFFITKK